MRKISCEHCSIRGSSIIADLTDGQIDSFRACGVSAVYRRRQVIFHERTPASGLYILCHGAVKLYQSDRFGRDHILEVAGPGDVLGELPTDPSEPYSVSAEAVTDAQLCYLPRERLVPFIEAYPQVGVRLIAALSRALSAARRKVRTLALKNAEGRLAELLLQLAPGNGGEGRPTRVPMPYSRREIGEMIGVSTETAIRLLAGLKQKRVIEFGRRDLVLVDPERLKRLAYQDSIEGA
ncbi:Crp/Fnr family transcriptional regulator [Candidatus Binatia bacterium]|nr:Crp/Fnr family transcriptional regulator [Candidatus Binatia bacterium]